MRMRRNVLRAARYFTVHAFRSFARPPRHSTATKVAASATTTTTTTSAAETRENNRQAATIN